MHLDALTFASILCALLPLIQPTVSARSKPEKVLLSNIRTLTLRKDATTSHNRVSPIPQLKCAGGTAKGLYEIDTLRCKNAGAGYSDDDVQWTCTANLPTEFKLGSTDVICEGFANPDDPYVLKGSCGVDYRLMLTDEGARKFGRVGKEKDQMWDWQPDAQRSKGGDFAAVLFWVVFVAVVGWMVYAAFIRDAVPRRPRGGAGGNFGGWGGGGGGGGGPGDDPPPPYDYHPPPPKPKTGSSTSGAGVRGAQGQQGPGFWTGALGGAAAGAAASYLAGNRGGRTEPQQSRNQGSWGNGEGSSRMGGMGRSASSGSSSSPNYGSSRHESSGFGSTSRR